MYATFTLSFFTQFFGVLSSVKLEPELIKLHINRGEVSTGVYKYVDVRTRYEGANGIRSEARGALKNLGEDIEAQTVTGSFSFVGDDGQTYSITYTADENGYQPQGAHLPTPPPIPDAIVKALEFIARNPPPPEEDQSPRARSQIPAARSRN